MGTITVNITNETETRFRDAVRDKIGTGKGKLGKAVEEAMNKWIEEEKTDYYVKEALQMMKKGLYKVGKDYTFKREEAYEDRLRKQGSAN